LTSAVARGQFSPSGDPIGRDAILDWNAVALEAVVADHTLGGPTYSQGGPTRASRALAIVHAAMFDAANSVEAYAKPYLTFEAEPKASLDAAVAEAAADTLAALYPAQSADFRRARNAYVGRVRNREARLKGLALGDLVAERILRARQRDGSQFDPPYVPGTNPGDHNVDPLNPGQGFLTPGWGNVTPFAIARIGDYRAPRPPALLSENYKAAFNEVRSVGEKNSKTRTREQTLIGIYWAYDGMPGVGVPPRLYNQIARVIAQQERNSEIENARLFALLNIAMADAGISCWDTKYHYNFWRPVLAIRSTVDPGWEPLGAPATNGGNGGRNFTPNFPAYTSGHATFGAASFKTLANFYGTDEVAFEFVSDELNGRTRGSDGVTVRPRVPRRFKTFSSATEENAISRIYLGIHWRFDAEKGVAAGNELADKVYETVLTLRHKGDQRRPPRKP
jgi:hypothetical protein